MKKRFEAVIETDKGSKGETNGKVKGSGPQVLVGIVADVRVKDINASVTN